LRRNILQTNPCEILMRFKLWYDIPELFHESYSRLNFISNVSKFAEDSCFLRGC
jgi:hypothetical protein